MSTPRLASLATALLLTIPGAASAQLDATEQAISAYIDNTNTIAATRDPSYCLRICVPVR